MSKINLDKIVNDIQKLYVKDKKATSIITTGASIKADYTEKDGIPLPESHLLRRLSGLPVIPFNKIVQVAGAPDSGKSTAASETIVAAQKVKAEVIVWDSEDKFDTKRLKNMGANPNTVLLVKTNEILKGGELVRKYITAIKEQDADTKILLVWDSVGGSQSRSHAERELDSEKHAQPGQDAKEVGSVMKMLISLINKYPDTLTIYIANQTYAKIGFMQKGSKASGGDKLTFHSSLIIYLKQIKALTKIVKGVVIKTGIITQATVTKNHLSAGTTSVHKMNFEVTSLGYTGTAEINEEADDEA